MLVIVLEVVERKGGGEGSEKENDFQSRENVYSVAVPRKAHADA